MAEPRLVQALPRVDLRLRPQVSETQSARGTSPTRHGRITPQMAVFCTAIPGLER